MSVKKRLMTPLGHQSLLFHCPVSPRSHNSPQSLPLWLKNLYLPKGDTNPNLSTFEQILAVHSDNFAGFDTCKLSFFLCQSLCSWKIELHDMACSDRCRYRKCNKDACFANIATSTVKKSVSFRYPNANRPGTLTGQETVFRLSLRCSTKASIVLVSLKTIFRQ